MSGVMGKAAQHCKVGLALPPALATRLPHLVDVGCDGVLLAAALVPAAGRRRRHSEPSAASKPLTMRAYWLRCHRARDAAGAERNARGRLSAPGHRRAVALVAQRVLAQVHLRRFWGVQYDSLGAAELCINGQWGGSPPAQGGSTLTAPHAHLLLPLRQAVRVLLPLRGGWRSTRGQAARRAAPRGCRTRGGCKLVVCGILQQRRRRQVRHNLRGGGRGRTKAAAAEQAASPPLPAALTRRVVDHKVIAEVPHAPAHGAAARWSCLQAAGRARVLVKRSATPGAAAGRSCRGKARPSLSGPADRAVAVLVQTISRGNVSGSSHLCAGRLERRERSARRGGMRQRGAIEGVPLVEETGANPKHQHHGFGLPVMVNSTPGNHFLAGNFAALAARLCRLGCLWHEHTQTDWELLT